MYTHHCLTSQMAESATVKAYAGDGPRFLLSAILTGSGKNALDGCNKVFGHGWELTCRTARQMSILKVLLGKLEIVPGRSLREVRE